MLNLEINHKTLLRLANASPAPLLVWLFGRMSLSDGHLQPRVARAAPRGFLATHRPAIGCWRLLWSHGHFPRPARARSKAFHPHLRHTPPRVNFCLKEAGYENFIVTLHSTLRKETLKKLQIFSVKTSLCSCEEAARTKLTLLTGSCEFSHCINKILPEHLSQIRAFILSHLHLLKAISFLRLC